MKLQSARGDASSAGETEPSGAPQQTDPWEQAPVPAKAARKLLEGVFDAHIPAERIGLVSNVSHWGYGTGWGAVYGLITGTSPGPALRRGLLFGTGVWVMSYVMLVPMGLYQPPWKYSAEEVAMDLSFHLVYGVGVGAGYAALDR